MTLLGGRRAVDRRGVVGLNTMETMLLTCTDIEFAYRSDRRLFESFSCGFEGGNTLLLGPNGAGKSTLLRLLATSIRPIRGSIALGSIDAARAQRQYRDVVGMLGQDVAPIPGLTVREQVAYAGWLKGMSKKAAWERSVEVLDSLDLSDLSDRKPTSISGGQLRRVGIAQLLVHDPEVMLLDEPTAGLDPLQRRNFMSMVAGFRGERSTIISSHQVEDIDSVFDHVYVLIDAELLFHGTVQEFLAISADRAAPPELQAIDAYERIVTDSGHGE
ncbi:MAG: ATP-binding cassette domain-containing protein [Solirubrobacterales bacterium]|nr:ATP-binding cassette domain-containing protein [Solirubrobacterales bacterium]